MSDDKRQEPVQEADVHQIYLALGSNQGDRQQNLSDALRCLRQSGISLHSVSSLYETRPAGYLDQPLFYNIACAGTTPLSAQQVLETAKRIEEQLGRRPTFRNGPRLIDIDILLFDSAVINQERLCVPHPRMRERAFVLDPLAEIAPNVKEPVTGQTIYALAQNVSHQGIVQVVRHWSDNSSISQKRRTS